MKKRMNDISAAFIRMLGSHPDRREALLKFSCILAVLLAASMLCLSVTAFDANDYDYGGGGGGGFSYSSGDDYGGGGDLTSLLIAIVIVAIMCIYWAVKDKIDKRRKKKEPKTPAAPVILQPKAVPANNGEGLGVPIPNRNADIRDILKRSDPDFSEQVFLGNAVKLFADIQGAVCARETEALRSLITPEMSVYLTDKVRALSERNITEHCEKLAVTNAYFTSLVREGGAEYLTVFIGAQYMRWLTDDSTGSIVEGDTSTVWSYRWLMTFSRTVGADPANAGECSHCGAPLGNTTSEKCEYCGCAVSVAGGEWLVCRLDTVHNDTSDNGIKL